MSDKDVRSKLEKLDGFVFDEIPWTTPKPLSESRVAIVTTAGLTEDGNADWNRAIKGSTVLHMMLMN